MVILRDLSDARDYPLEIPSVGSDLERQVRSHYTRADGTLNTSDYFTELSGFQVNSSDLESGSSDSDSDSSGNDGDCVIISPSSFTSKKPNNHSLIVADSVSTISTSMEISSKFTTHEFVSTFRKAVKLTDLEHENLIITDPVNEGEYVTTVNAQEPHYFYMYTRVIQTLNIWLPFTTFEGQMLKTMNIAPNQLHPNSWAFIKAFEVVCRDLEIVPTIGIFFCFFQVKHLSPHSLISLSSQANRGCFSLYASNFKHYRDTFARFRCGEGFSDLLFVEFDEPLFPFYWSSSPRLIRGTKVETLNEYEREAVKFLATFKVMSSGDLLTRETTPESLGEYMGKITFVLKAREAKQKAVAAAALVDPLTQLVVEESASKGAKRKKQEELRVACY
ncbi:hypothetical protein TSUD_155380 [Trifolium subterraneum]|uniref:Transposase (putative) gypsy type domain-containing protein n=1 Tax=Trifolium subterraneum TaxID=3900 RepID=A0A2Z6NZB6_TRISU|nr:hypothetical protein TSUD_155380 [Trifolium subterraneum]